MMDSVKYEHPSYATIGVYQVSGRGEILFASSIKHSEVIRIVVSTATMERSLHADRIHGDDQLIVVEMSYSQFAEMITSHSRGTGVPCTLRRFNGESIPSPPFLNKQQQHRDEFKEQTKAIADYLDETIASAEKLLDAPNVGKAARKELLHRLKMAKQKIESDMPFAIKQFDEQIDQTLLEAKGEIEAFALKRFLGDAVLPQFAVLERDDEEVREALQLPAPDVQSD